MRTCGLCRNLLRNGRLSIVLFVLGGAALGPAFELRGDDESPVEAPRPEAAAVESAAPTYQTADGRFLLRYRFQENEIIFFDVTHKVSVEIRKEQTVELTKNQSDSRKHYRVISVDSDGSALLELVIDTARMWVQFNDADPVRFDSESDEEAPAQFGSVKQTIGVPLARIKVSNRGELLTATRLQHDPAAKAGQQKNVEQTPDNDPSHNFLIVMPDSPLAVGESWKDSLTIKVRVPGSSLTRDVTLVRQFQLTAVEDNIATIELKTSVLTPVRDPQIRMQLMQRLLDGKIRFDLRRGLISSRTLQLDRREVGVIGDQSLMRVVSDRTETIVDKPRMAAREK